jgi:lipoprotein NlpD
LLKVRASSVLRLHNLRIKTLLNLRLVLISQLGIILSIFLCSCSLVRSTPEKYIVYPIKSGDTLAIIGKRFDVSYKDLMQINSIHDPKKLRAGMRLKVPYKGQSLAKTLQDLDPNLSPGLKNTTNASSRAPAREVLQSESKRHIGRLIWPASLEAKLSSRFGRRWLSFHEGIDLSGEEGLPIYAAHDGVVVYSGDGIKGYGNLVILKASYGLLTVYAHNRKNLVRKGEKVDRGEKIATLGSSGHSTGPHLHFETRIMDKSRRYAAVDPLTFYPGR